MARCDGRWHPLETEMIESFASSLWIQSEWEGDPDIDEIVVHAQRISLDADSFFAALRRYAQDPLLTRLICRAAGNLIAADDRKRTRLNSSQQCASRIQSLA